MRLIRALAGIAMLAGLGVAGWFAALAWIPSHASDVIWAGMHARGLTDNVLNPARTPHAGQDAVPLANPDMISRAAIYDLSDGPLLFEADVPTGLQYWSVTVFAHNSDTLFVANDRATGPGRFSLVIRKPDQRSRLPVDTQVVSPSDRGFILVRAVMKDRNDPADVRRTIAAVAPERVRTVKDDATR